MVSIRSWLLCMGLLLPWAALAAMEDVIVMVEARERPNAGFELGAGVIVSQTAARTVIVTARHVVANEQGDLAPDLRIEFSTRRGKFFAASANPTYADRSLDLAVLFIDHATAPDVPRVITDDTRRLLSPTAATQLTGAQVTLIGAIGRKRWARGLQNDVVVGGDLQALRVKSDEARAGASGGGLFDSLGRLLAMASNVDMTTGLLNALPIDTALGRLRRWGVEVSLETATAATTSPALMAQMREGLRFEVVYLEPPPQFPGGIWPWKSGNGFAHRLTAQLSPALRELSPLLSLQFPDHPSMAAIDLRGPAYSLEGQQHPVAFEAQAFMTLPDGRKLGPMPVRLDFAIGPGSMAAQLGGDAPDAVDRRLKFFEFNERESRSARQRSDTLYAELRTTNAQNQEQAMLKQYPLLFPSWKMRCRQVHEVWECSGSSHIPRNPYQGKLANVVHGLKLGKAEDDLAITLPIDPSVDLLTHMPKEAAGLLNRGAQELFVWMRLATGEALGPKRLCKVRLHNKQPICD